MKYIELLEKINTPVFSTQDLKISGVSIFPYQISKLNKDGYIQKIKNGLYIFSNKKELIPLEHIAFKIYEPSYISLEWALHHYGLIPEMVYNITSVSTKTSRKFKNDFGIFIYRNIEKKNFSGGISRRRKMAMYTLLQSQRKLYLIIFILIYLKSKIRLI